jgi:hypothetical protein
MSRLLAIFACLGLAPLQAAASDLDEAGCLHDQERYPEGYELCLSGTLKRCEHGAWADVGMCGEEEMAPPTMGDEGPINR